MTTRIDRDLVLAGCALAVALAFAPATSAQTDQAALMALSREARSVTEHADLARRFRLQAEAFDVRAAEKEAQVARTSRNAPGIAHKWPAMVPQALNQAKQQALDARRAAQESRTMADRHLRLAVEAQADPRPVGD